MFIELAIETNKYIVMKNVVFVFWISLFGMSAFAQDQVQKTPEERASKRMEKLKSSLELNSDQEVVIKDALITKMTKAKAAREKHSESKEGMKKEMHVIHSEFREVMKKTLTDSQYEKWKEMRKTHKHHHKNHKYKDLPKEQQRKKHPESERKQNLEDK